MATHYIKYSNKISHKDLANNKSTYKWVNYIPKDNVIVANEIKKHIVVNDYISAEIILRDYLKEKYALSDDDCICDTLLQKQSMDNALRESTKDITLVILATNKYFKLAKRQILSIQAQNKANNIQYVLLTDSKEQIPGVDIFYIPHEQWPWVTTRKFEYLLKFADKFRGEYIVLQDADTSIYNASSLDLFKHSLFAVQHHMDGWFYKSHSEKPYDRNNKSLAFVPKDYPIDKPYVMGAIFGGKRSEILKVSSLIKDAIEVDWALNVMAAHNEESHWNKYVLLNDVHIIKFNDYAKVFAVSDKAGIDDK